MVLVLHNANVVNCNNLAVCLTPGISSVCWLCSVVRTECYLCTMYCSSILSLIHSWFRVVKTILAMTLVDIFV